VKPALDLRQHGVLCLDLGSVVGWSYGHIGGAMPAFGSWHLADTTLHGPRYVSYENELISALDRLRPRLVVMEAPLHSGQHKGDKAARLAFGLVAYTEGECHRSSVQVREQAASTARKAVIGQGRWSKGTAKDHVMAYCKLRGWPVPDHHAGDALVLLEYSLMIEARDAKLSTRRG